MTHAEYLSLPGINATAIKSGAVSMLHMRQAMTTQREPSSAMAFGTLVHAAVLQPTELLRVAAVWTGEAKRGKEWAQFKADNYGAIIVTPDELQALEHITGAVRANAKARSILDGCEYERTIQWQTERYGAAKARFDAVKPGAAVDVKTVSNISRRAVDWQAMALGYDLQVGWYVEGAAQGGFGDIAPEFWLLYIETVPPYDVWPRRVGFDVIERGQRRAVDIATRYRECERAGAWPGVATDDDVWSLPVWAQDELTGFDEGESTP
jgi:hypothetical protein